MKKPVAELVQAAPDGSKSGFPDGFKFADNALYSLPVLIVIQPPPVSTPSISYGRLR